MLHLASKTLRQAKERSLLSTFLIALNCKIQNINFKINVYSTPSLLPGVSTSVIASNCTQFTVTRKKFTAARKSLQPRCALKSNWCAPPDNLHPLRLKTRRIVALHWLEMFYYNYHCCIALLQYSSCRSTKSCSTSSCTVTSKSDLTVLLAALLQFFTSCFCFTFWSLCLKYIFCCPLLDLENEMSPQARRSNRAGQ